MKRIWKALIIPFKKKTISTKQVIRMHQLQLAEWEWINQRLADHFEQEGNTDFPHYDLTDKTIGHRKNSAF